MFASFWLPFQFRHRGKKTQSFDEDADIGRAEDLHGGPTESEKHSEGTLVADTSVLHKEPDVNWSTRNEIRRFGSTRKHGDGVRLHGDQRVYVVSEYWTSEDNGAIKGDNHQVHAIFSSVQEANAYPQKFVHQVLEPYVKSDAWHVDEQEQDIDIDNVRATKTSFMDGTRR